MLLIPAVSALVTISAGVNMKGTGFVLSLSNQYSFDSSEQVTTSAIVLNGTTQYSSWGSSQLVFALWNSSNSVYPKTTIILPSKPAYVLKAYNYTYQASNSSLIIFGKQSNQTVTVNVASAISGATTSLKIPAASVTITSVPSWDDVLKQLTIQSSGSSTGTISIGGQGAGPSSVTLGGVTSSAWAYDGSADVLTLTGAGSWLVTYVASNPGGGGSGSGNQVSTVVGVLTTESFSGVQLIVSNSTIASPQINAPNQIPVIVWVLIGGVVLLVIYQSRKKPF